MLRKLLTGFIALLWSAMALAAVEANHASAQDLGAIKGIGPVMASRIIEQRESAAFKDWKDFIARVKGVAPPTAAKFSAQGLTVNGARYRRSSTPADKAAAKPANRAGSAPEHSAPALAAPRAGGAL